MKQKTGRKHKHTGGWGGLAIGMCGAEEAQMDGKTSIGSRLGWSESGGWRGGGGRGCLGGREGEIVG